MGPSVHSFSLFPVAHFQTLSLPKPQPNRVSEGKKNEPENEERERERDAAIGLIRHNVVVGYSARPPDRWNTPSRRGYRQLESWHQTTMGREGRREGGSGRGREGREKARRTDADGGQVPISPKCLPPPSLPPYTILDHRYSPSSKSSPPLKISSGFDS